MDDRPGVRAALYARVSTAGQAERYGLDAQRRMLRDWAAQREYTAIADAGADVFADDESGGTLDRPAWRRVERLAQQGAIDVLVAVDPDRLSRDLADMLMLERGLTDLGVRVEFTTQEFEASPQGRAFFQIRGVFAELERNTIRERTARGRREKAAQGKIVNPRVLPTWLTMGPDGTKVELVPEWAQVVRDIFRWYAEEGLSVYAIARRLTDLRVTVPSGRGTRWQAATVHKWLSDPTAIGEYCQLGTVARAPRRPRPGTVHHHSSRMDRTRGSVVPVPAVVTREVWDAVQLRLEANARFSRRNGKRFYLLRGLLFCDACGRRMVGFANSGDGTRRYRCGSVWNPRVDGSTCPAPATVKADWIEAEVWERVSRLFLEPDTLQAELARRQDADSPTRTSLEVELKAAEKRLQTIPVERQRVLDQVAKGSLTDDEVAMWVERVREEARTLEDRCAVLRADLAAITSTEVSIRSALEFADQVRQGMDQLDDEGRAELLRQVVRRVTVRGRAESCVIDTMLPIGPETPTGGGDVSRHLHSHNREHLQPVRDPGRRPGEALATR
jgi:site-specific DNA recombinase